MERTLPAVYEHGALTPLEPLDLPEHQRVIITIHGPALESPDEALRAWQRVYESLSKEEIAEVETIALDRSRFIRSPHQRC
jgi:predicted DNA-binding antitoxin AbrB/MazE fold protein